MKKYQLLFTLMIGILSLGFGQNNESEAVAIAAENLRKAMLDGDEKALQNLSAPELSYGHSSGLVEDQTAFVQSIVTGKNDFITLETSDQTIKMVGNDVAIVRHNLKAQLKLLDGSTVTPNIGILLVWQKKNGQWKLLARQAFKR
jgi:ketosteroid isomerase-like protein